MNNALHRRDALKLAAGHLVGLLSPRPVPADEKPTVAKDAGRVVGQREASEVGAGVLAGGGNAVDATVAAALTASVVAISDVGIGGYGGHMVIARAGGQKVTAIDFNTAAPKAVRDDLFANRKGNTHGWRTVGVPGILAGLQLALDRYGSRPFAELVRPAIRFAQDGIELTPALAASIRTAAARLRQDPSAARLLLDHGEPPRAGSRHRNPDLADLLQALAEARSGAAFYRGDIARKIAAAARQHGGLLTEDDLTNYQAREIEPLELAWGGHVLYTAPLTAGGASVFQALALVGALGWAKGWPRGTACHARLDALRVAWDDRLRLMGDPAQVQVPLDRLLSPEYARKAADRVAAAVRDGKPVKADTDGRPADGTIHLSAGDAAGNLVAVTLTHGGPFGAQVVVDGLGLVLGHGLSRFDPRPGRPNSPGPGKRPLNNMCPTVLLKGGKPVLALGGRGGRKIPNAMFEVLVQYLGRKGGLDEAIAAPRLHTEGGLDVTLEATWPKADADRLREIGYTVTTGRSAMVSAVEFDPAAGTCHAASR